MRIISKLLSIMTCTLALVGCNGGTTVGNPLIHLQMTSFVAMSSKLEFPFLEPDQQALTASPLTVSSLTFCFKRLRFKTVGGTGDNSGNVDFDLGEVSINASGTSLGNVNIPAGTYDRIEFDLESHCSSGKSIQLINTNGTFTTTDTITIKFDGNINISADTVIDLTPQSIITALDAVTADNEIKTQAEAASGTF